MNCLIILIAMAAAAIYDIFLNKNWKEALIYLAALFMITGGMKIGSDALLEHITGMEKSEGVPFEAWIAMGLQDGGRGAGNYNGYNLEVYLNNGYDSQRAREEARENIKESLHKFADAPGYAWDFFARKTAGQWNTPNCWAVVNGMEKESGLSWMINSMQAGRGKTFSDYFLNLFQTWILLGTVCYLLMEKNKSELEWIFLLVFLSGFLFHTFWESGARYAFPYYLMIIPYGVIGLSLLEKKLEKTIEKKREENSFHWKGRLGGICSILFLTALFLPCLNFFVKAVIIYEEEERAVPVYIKDGIYTVASAEDNELFLTETDGNIILMNRDNIIQEVSIFRSGGTHMIRFMPSQNTLEIAGGGAVLSESVEYEFGWQIKPAGEADEYYILMDDKTALEYSLEDWSVRLTDYEEGNRMQIWVIR